MGFSWNQFGILAFSREDSDNFYIVNAQKEERKVSKKAYAAQIPNLKKKVEALKGKPILFRTSQNTADWSTGTWFSDIDIDENGFKHPEKIEPLSQISFHSGDEPEPETHGQLKEKIRLMELRHSEDKESWAAERNQLSTSVGELELIVAELKAEARASPEDQNKENEEHARKLSEMDIVGTNQIVKCVGHPARELTLRIGEILPEGKKNIEITFGRHLNSNNFEINLPEFGNKHAVASIGVDQSKCLFVKSLRNPDPSYFQVFKQIMGVGEESFKNRTMSDDERLKIFNKVNASLPVGTGMRTVPVFKKKSRKRPTK